MTPQEAVEFLRIGEVPSGKSAAEVFDAIAKAIEDQQREIEWFVSALVEISNIGMSFGASSKAFKLAEMADLALMRVFQDRERRQ